MAKMPLKRASSGATAPAVGAQECTRKVEMSSFLWIGTGLGAFFGILHGAYLYRQQIAVRGRAAGLYYGIWTFALWTLFGAYVLVFWILGFILYSIGRLAPGDRWSARSAKG